MALNAAKVRARVVCTISTPGHFCLFLPAAFMNGHRLSGRYCVPQTLDQSERAANDWRQTVGNAASREESPTKGARSLRICSPVLVYGRLISLPRFETMAPNNRPPGILTRAM